jgi:predicted outer membrane repeat protein
MEVMRHSFSTIALAWGCFVMACAANASILYVDATSGSEGADGSSWETAYPDLQSALAVSNTGEIWVAAGKYRPAPSGGDRSLSFVLPDNVALYGGFIGGETDRAARDPEVNQTILSGDLNGDDESGNTLDNSNRVVKLANSLSETNRLDGFIIEGGQTAPPSTLLTGAGLYIENARLAIANCTFRDNFASNNGGAVYVTSGAIEASQIVFQKCSFSRNGSQGLGTAIFATPNSAGTQYPSLVIEDCLFQGNGFLYPVSANSTVITLRRSYFMDNEGGALSANDRVTLTAENCVFMRNGGMNGAVYVGTRSQAEFRQCTLAENYTKELYVVADTYLVTRLSITNSIVWNDYYPAIEVYTPTAANAEVSVTRTLILGGYAGEGNMDMAPRFRLADPPGQPNWDSPSIDFCAESSITEDIEGQPRPQNDAFDAGAYEFGEDTDGGGLPDAYEDDWDLNPALTEDDGMDADDDGLDNLEEYRRGTNPQDDTSPPSEFYVNQNGSDETGSGSSASPWKTIAFAMAHLPEAMPTFPVTLYVGAGTYDEQIVFRPYVRLEGAGVGLTVLRHFDITEDDHYVVESDVGTSLSNCTVTLPSPVSVTVDLLRITDTDLSVSFCELDGLNSPYAIAAFITGPKSSPSVIRDSTLRRVEYGIYAVDSGVNITRNLFEDILEGAVFVRAPEGKAESEVETPLLGNGDRIEDTGFNLFRMSTGFFVNNTSAALTLAEFNDWGVYTEEEIGDRVLNAPGDVDYTPYMGKALVKGMIAVELLEAVSRQNIPLSASPAVQMNFVSGLYDEVSGLFLFANLDAGSYTCRASATGYVPGTRFIYLAAGKIESLTMALEKNAEDEGEGETATEGEAENEGETHTEGEMPQEGEGPAEGEGELTGEGEITAEGELFEGEGQREGEGEGEGEEEKGCFGRDKSKCIAPAGTIRRVLNEWLLLGVAFASFLLLRD